MRKLKREYGAYRCQDCHKLTADAFIRQTSECAKCGGKRFQGAARFTWFEGLQLWIKLHILEWREERKNEIVK